MSSRPKRQRIPPSGRLPIDYSNIFFCFIYEKSQNDEKYSTISFNAPYLRLSVEEKLALKEVRIFNITKLNTLRKVMIQ